MGVKQLLGLHEFKDANFWRAVIAEVLASAIYIIIVCGCGLSEAKPSHLHISLTVAFTVAVLASAFWDISGGHFNPAVTFSLLILKKVSITRFVVYVIAQCVGSVGGAALLYLFTPKSFRSSLGALSIHPDISPGIAFLIEITITFPFIWTVVASTDPIKKFTGFETPFVIGLSVGIGLLMGIPYTGAALNPIRAFGPAIIMDKRDNHWVYWAGPFLGAAMATICYEYIFKLTVEQKEEYSDTELHTVAIKNNHAKHIAHITR